MRRIFFFLLTNILVIATISITYTLICTFFGITPGYYNEYGINYTGLAIFAGIFGMGGAFISLFISKWMAKRMFRLQMVGPQTSNPEARWVYDTVQKLSTSAKLPKTPEVGIYDSPEVNAFATGPSKGNSLVAVSTGLLRSMNKGEAEAVLGHEVAHIANGDMVTLTLIQGVVNAFAIFLSRIAAHVVGSMISRSDDGPSPFLHFGLVIAFDILFTFLGSFVVMAFSRYREYRADAGGAQLAGNGQMIAALQKLKGSVDRAGPRDEKVAAFMISNKSPSSFWANMMRTHPSLDDRIEALKKNPAGGL